MADNAQFEAAVDQVIEDSERLHKIVNGSGTDTVLVEDGSTVPTVRKALLDSVYFKTPPLPWAAGTQTTVFNQLYSFTNSAGTRWWYAPGATASNPVILPTDPSTSTAWRVYNDASVIQETYAPLNTPSFVGSPTAPTPPSGSNSAAIATTAFVVSAIAAAINGLSGTSVSYSGLTVSGASVLNTLTVNGTSQFKGNVDASDVTGRFQNMILTKQNSTLSFTYTAGSSYLKTILSPNAVQTHNITSAVIVNGTAVADDTTMSLTGVGNNSFDYVYIKGNSQKSASTPRLKVSGFTEVENLRVTGSMSGVNVGVDGLDISPNSVTVTTTVDVGSDLTVGGVATLGDVSIQNLEVLSTLEVTGNSNLVGGFTAGSASSVTGNLGVTGTLAVTGAATVSTNLTVTGDANLNNGGTGTTTVQNLNVLGTLTGVSVDVTGKDINPNSVLATTNIEAYGSLKGDTLIIGATPSTFASDVTVTGAISATTYVSANVGMATKTLTASDAVSSLGTLSVTGLSTLTGGFTTSSGNGTVGGTLTVTGITTLNGNVVISGTRTLTVGGATQINNTLTATGNVTLNTATTGTTSVFNLTVNGTSTLKAVTATTVTSSRGTVGYIGFTPGAVTTPSVTTWTPGGDGTDLTKMNNVYNVDLTNNLTIGPWANLGTAFSAMIYLFQDATGGRTVTLDASYKVLNSETINTAANAVTILQVTYCGRGSVYDVVIIRRP